MHLVSQARRPGAFTPLAALALVLVALVPALAAATERTLYPFVAYPSSGTQRTGIFPSGTLVRDATGALFGATSLGGIYWTAKVLHHFNVSTGGHMPYDELVASPAGQLFGVTYEGGPGLGGTVFAVTP